MIIERHRWINKSDQSLTVIHPCSFTFPTIIIIDHLATWNDKNRSLFSILTLTMKHAHLIQRAKIKYMLLRWYWNWTEKKMSSTEDNAPNVFSVTDKILIFHAHCGCLKLIGTKMGGVFRIFSGRGIWKPIVASCVYSNNRLNVTAFWACRYDTHSVWIDTSYATNIEQKHNTREQKARDKNNT